MKTYVLDTDALLHNPQAIYAFQDNNVVLPLVVIEEVDNQKKRQDELGRNARTVSRELDALRAQGSLAEGVRLPRGGHLRIELNHNEAVAGFPQILGLDKPDNRILRVAWNLKSTSPHPMALVTKDLNLRVKADVLGIPADDFLNDKIDYDTLCTGVGEQHLSAKQIEAFYNDGRLKPRNKEQRFALELLLNDEIKVVGPAGTSKTLLALAAGLEKVMEQKSHKKLLVTRPIMPMGNDLG